MKQEVKLLFIVFIYTIILLLLCVGVFSIFNSYEKNFDEETFSQSIEDVKTEAVIHIPIYVESIYSETIAETDTDTKEQKSFIVKSYNGKIGIFSSQGELLRILEVYTKTLPTTDQNLLEEGIEVYGEEKLRNIIEDYTG